MMNNKEIYRELCQIEKSIPIFSQAWWLDAVCGHEKWDVCIYKKNDRILGAMPYYLKKYYRYNLVVQPPLTQTLGPWFKNIHTKYYKQLSHQYTVMNELIKKIPDFDYFNQSWHYSNQNWLPFYWNNYTQTSHYTYILENLADLENIWKSFNDSARREIRKAENRYKLIVQENSNLHDFFELNKSTYRRQKKEAPYSLELLERIDNVCKERQCRKIIIAIDNNGNHHAGAYIIWDENSAYYLMGGINENYKNSGGMSLVMWKAIRISSKITKSFDFEGSMIKNVERFFRSFGAIQKQYFQLQKTNSKSLKILKKIKSFTNDKS